MRLNWLHVRIWAIFSLCLIDLVVTKHDLLLNYGKVCSFLLNLLSFLLNKNLENLVFIDCALVILVLNLFKNFSHVNFLDSLQLLILNLLKHAVKSILHAILSSSRQMLDDFWPSVSYLLSQLKYFEILFIWKRVSVNFRIEEVVPPFSALLAVPVDSEFWIENLSYFLPLLCTLLAYNGEQLIVFFLLPLSLCNAWFVALIPFVLALSIVSPRD